MVEDKIIYFSKEEYKNTNYIRGKQCVRNVYVYMQEL